MIHPALDLDPPDERLHLLRFLLTDRDWQCEPAVRQLLQGLLLWPPVCREANWQALAEETAAYLAFRKQAEVAARARDCPTPALVSSGTTEPAGAPMVRQQTAA
ncbi:MAG: hypothetical protein KA124_00055 [Luteimonas sp.]|nr:hypothetical protein [Luteimonas sp.]